MAAAMANSSGGVAPKEKLGSASSAYEAVWNDWPETRSTKSRLRRDNQTRRRKRASRLGPTEEDVRENIQRLCLPHLKITIPKFLANPDKYWTTCPFNPLQNTNKEGGHLAISAPSQPHSLKS